MMHAFLSDNRAELIARCKAKVLARPRRAATDKQLAHGVPMFLSQLTRTLRAEEMGEAAESLRISGASGGDVTDVSEIGAGAAVHGKELLDLGFSVDQVVHDYGDLCQAITDLAVERDAPFAVNEFRTLNRCLDNAIADAVTEFGFQRDSTVARKQAAELNERLGALAHELRNSLNTATLAFTALESGKLPIGGSTGAVLKRSLASLTTLVDQSLMEVRTASGAPVQTQMFSLSGFVSDARNVASLLASSGGRAFPAQAVDPLLGVVGNRDLLLAALVNLLQNAFKFTRSHSEVTLNAYGAADRILIDVKDGCGGLAPGSMDSLFKPFSQSGDDKSGLGLGLFIARKSVEADGGFLTVRDVPGTGCVFTISLPRHTLP